MSERDRRGFASMDAEKLRKIASMGGKAAHEKGTAHQWTSAEAQAAGRKGGAASRGGRGKLGHRQGLDSTGGENTDGN